MKRLLYLGRSVKGGENRVFLKGVMVSLFCVIFEALVCTA